MINKMFAVMFMVGLIAAGGCTTDWFGSRANTQQPMPVQNFVDLRFVDRWPVVKAYRYGSDASTRSASVQTLKNILEDPNRKTAWANSVATLGMVGGDQAWKVIDKFITTFQQSTSLSLYEQRAMHSGVVALGSWTWTSKHRPGLVVEDAHIQRALKALKLVVRNCGKFNSIAILKQGFLDLKTHQKQMKDLNRAANAKPGRDNENDAIKKQTDSLQGVQAQIFLENPICPSVSDTVLQREFAQAALWGLALSGEKTAGETLLEFTSAQDGDSAVKQFIPEAQIAHARITQIGLLCYYEPYSLECQQMTGFH
ncbi:MAG: hypothetical protein R3351_09790 [Nitrospirales bacterium]|nr:hypothetical protein [Nitrospirales bacterium]